MSQRVLIIGGGVAGLQAALDIANAGLKVTLVEREHSLGGRAAQVYKTFPNLIEVKSILKPMMEFVYLNKSINTLTNSIVRSVEGEFMKFNVVIEKRPRYVDIDKCDKCGKCSEVCPIIVPNEFDMNLSERRAIYLPFKYAIPPAYAVDLKSCIHFSKGCNRCVEACPNNAINFYEKPEVINDTFCSIIVATGFDQFNAVIKEELSYGVYKSVITELELERMLDEEGPMKGELIINGKVPKDIIFIQCVGSRDRKIGNTWCSRVCCMNTMKQAYLIKEKIPDANVQVMFIDVRAFGKNHEEFYELVQKKGIIYNRGIGAEVYKRGDKLIVRAEDTLLSRPYEIVADLVVLAAGIIPREDTKALAEVLKIKVGEDGFLLERDRQFQVESTAKGIFIAGCCQSPKDIADSITQGSAAAAKVIGAINEALRSGAP